MKKIPMGLVVLHVLMLSGCCVGGSAQYKKGIECLDHENYSDAITYLGEAVRLGPTSSRNQNQLAVAYMAIDDLNKAWYHSRKAVLCEPLEEESAKTFNNLYKILVKDTGLDDEGTRYEDIVNALGEPDSILEGGRIGEISVTYGLCTMFFRRWELSGRSFRIYVDI